MRITPLSDALGAEITEIDVANLNRESLILVQDTFLEHQLIVFRDQTLTPEEHIKFSQNFGELEIHIAKNFLLEEHPEILILSNRKKNGEYIGVENAGDYWHSDLSYMEKPSLGSLLYALEVPDEGGDSEWSNMYTAYETLSDAKKKRIDRLKATYL